MTGQWLTAEEATSGQYWARHMSSPVRYADDLATVWRLPAPVMVEVGPGQGLGALALAHPDRPAEVEVVSLLATPARSGTDLPAWLAALGRLWTLGLPVDRTLTRSR